MERLLLKAYWRFCNERFGARQVTAHVEDGRTVVKQDQSKRIQDLRRVVAEMLEILDEVEKTTRKAKQRRLLARAIALADAVLAVRVRDLPSWGFALRMTMDRLHDPTNQRLAARLRACEGSRTEMRRSRQLLTRSRNCRLNGCFCGFPGDG
jgi:hypothetical protein